MQCYWFFLKVDIEHTFVFPNIMLHTGEKCHVQRQSSFWQKHLLQKHLIQSCYFMLFWPSSILAKSLFIHIYYTQWWCIQWCLQKHLSPWITKISWTLWYPCHFVNCLIEWQHREHNPSGVEKSELHILN